MRTRASGTRSAGAGCPLPASTAIAGRGIGLSAGRNSQSNTAASSKLATARRVRPMLGMGRWDCDPPGCIGEVRREARPVDLSLPRQRSAGGRRTAKYDHGTSRVPSVRAARLLLALHHASELPGWADHPRASLLARQGWRGPRMSQDSQEATARQTREPLERPMTRPDPACMINQQRWRDRQRELTARAG